MKLTEVYEMIDGTNMFDDDDSRLYQVAVVLFSALICGGNVNRTAQFTGKLKHYVAQVIGRCKKNGIIQKKGLFRIEWEDGDIKFLMDAMVGAGDLVRKEENGELLYKLKGK